jgi:hypothetical protein
LDTRFRKIAKRQSDKPARDQPEFTEEAIDYPGHGLDNINTQYYQIIGGHTTYIGNVGSFGGAYVDTSD